MKKLAVTIFILTASFTAFAQTKTVTNQDLEKFRQERLESERKLKADYAKLGTTPEEVESQNRQRRAEFEQYSNQLRVWRILAENERIAQENARLEYERSFENQPNYAYFYNGVPYVGYYQYGWRGNRSVLPGFRNLPPNMRTAQEYAVTQWNSGTRFNTPRPVVRGGGWRGGNSSPRPSININIGGGGRRF